MNTYIIKVVTSDIRNSGTDANVYIELLGKHKSSGRIPLIRSKTNKNSFERGQTDVFEVNCDDIRTIKRIIIGHDGKGMMSDWHLKEVIVESLSDGRKWLCESNRWLSKDKEDGRIEIELEATEMDSRKLNNENNDDLIDRPHSRNSSSSRKHSPFRDDFEESFYARKRSTPIDEQYLDPYSRRSPHNKRNTFESQDSKIWYKIFITTSKLKFSGTTSKVFIKLYGKKGQTDNIKLKTSMNHKIPFKGGQTDEFEIESPDLGTLSKIKINTDYSGTDPAWHCADVKIEAPNGSIAYFPCNKWFDINKDDGKIEHTLHREEMDKENLDQPFQDGVSYRINVFTSDKSYAGTDSKVFIKLYGFGEFNETPDIELKKSKTNKNPFEKGSKDQFEIITKDIGAIRKIKIRHDNTGINPSWHLNMIKIEIPSGQIYTFVCDKWLGLNEDDGRIERILYPEESESAELYKHQEKENRPYPKEKNFIVNSKPCYKIQVSTSDRKNAGTRSNVYLKIYGQLASSEKLLLKNSKTNKYPFDIGSIDVFEFDLPELGPIRKIKIGHDNSMNGWHLRDIQIETPIREFLLFPCNMWLDTREDDGKIERVLYPEDRINSGRDSIHRDASFRDNFLEKNDRLGSDRFEMAESTFYKVHVTTSNKFSAGTDSKVFIKLYGENGSTDKIILKKSKTNKNPFEKGKTDTFELDLSNLGPLKKIKIGHDNTGSQSGWHLADVKIETPNRDVYVFPCNKWFDVKEDDGKIERSLYPDDSLFQPGKKSFEKEKYLHDRGENFNRLKEDNSRFENKIIKYKIEVTTSNKAYAGTDANVFLKIYGENASTDRLALVKSKTNKNPFEQGKTDVFTFELPNLGNIKKIKIGHDNKGRASGWHCKDVKIESENGFYLFPCEKWFDEKEADGKIERTLYPDPSLMNEEKFSSPRRGSSTERSSSRVDELDDREGSRFYIQNNLNYKIQVATSNKKHAGTDSNVYIKIYGRSNKTDLIYLKKSLSHKNPFEKGNVDIFELNLPDLGEIRKIKIGHDNKGNASGWHLDSVQIETQDKQVYHFPCNRWLDKKEDDGLIERILYPNNFESLKPEKNFNRSLEVIDRDDKELIIRDIPYKILVSTSDKPYASTDSKVYIQLIGKRLETERIFLRKSKTHKNPFEQGNNDEFEFIAPDVGELKRIKIGHDNSGNGAAWHCKEVKILTGNQQTYVFPCDKWFDTKQDDGLIERILFPLESKQDRMNKYKDFIGKNLDYVIYVKTSDIENAGTDSLVHIKIFGDLRSSENIRLNKSLTNKNKFEKGNNDKFQVREEFFGEIRKIKIGHDNSATNPNWHLSEVIIESKDLNKRWIFPCNRWLSKEKNDKQIEVELGCSDIIENINERVYFIDVFTGDLPESGTNANVFLTIIGENSESPEIELKESESHLNKFERNQTDRFVYISPTDLGNLNAIRIKHDNSGVLPDWFLAKVEIVEKDSKTKYSFTCNKWLSQEKDDAKIERILKEDSAKELKLKIKKKNLFLNSKQYFIKIFTGPKQSINGTDMNVSIKIFGDNGQSEEIKLAKTLTNEIKFLPNQIDLFPIEIPENLGTLYAIELKFKDSMKTSNDLHLLKVEIDDSTVVYRFEFNDFISIKNTKERFLKKILLESNAQF